MIYNIGKSGIGMLGSKFDELRRFASDSFDGRFYGDPTVEKQKEVFMPDTELILPEANIQPITLADLEGEAFVSTMSDRSEVNKRLVGIGGKPLDIPIDLTGGQGFMFYNPDMWASGVGKPTDDMLAAAQEMKSLYGVNPLFMPWTMTPSGGDFAHMTGQVMLSFANKYMAKGPKKELDKYIESVLPDWVGLDNPDMIKQWGSIPDKKRKLIMTKMDNKYRDKGSITRAQARLAVADPNQLNKIDGSFLNVGRFDVEGGLNPKGGNPTYGMAVKGEGLFQLPVGSDVPTIFDMEARKLARAVNTEGKNKGLFSSGPQGDDFLSTRAVPRRALELGPFGGQITEDLLRRLKDDGFKIDANGYVTAAAAGGGLMSMMGSDDSYAGGPESQYDPTSMSGVLGISPEMIEAMAQKDALDQQRMAADQQRYGQYADDQMMPREQTYSEQLGNYLANLSYGDDSNKSQQRFAQSISGILDFTPVGSADALKLGVRQKEAGNTAEGWLNSILGASEAAIPAAGLGYKYGKKALQGLMEKF